MELSLDAIGSARTVLIAGPTASGKSAAALALADTAARSGRTAWIVNADAMQVYEGLRILTARPREADCARAPHRLYGHVPPRVRYSVGAWLTDVALVLREAKTAGTLPIVIGGTGLYFKALAEGLATIPDIPLDVRERWSERLQSEGVAALHAMLAEQDPASAAAIRPSDPQRVLRALEVFEVTGLTLEERLGAPALPPLISAEETAMFVIEVDRATLHRRIEERFDRMVGEGALGEVQALVALGLDANLPAMKAIGVREFSAVLREEMTLDAAVAKAKTETRRYAKRQDTWFRNQMRDWRRVSG
jgi:tRNA dimethylallyltransferase